MHTFFQKLRVLADLIISVSLFYLGLAAAYPTMLINLVLIVVGVFVLLQCLGCVDEINGFGRKKDKEITPPEKTEGDDVCDES